MIRGAEASPAPYHHHDLKTQPQPSRRSRNQVMATKNIKYQFAVSCYPANREVATVKSILDTCYPCIVLCGAVGVCGASCCLVLDCAGLDWSVLSHGPTSGQNYERLEERAIVSHIGVIKR
jgi:hypothetical protein